MFQSYHSPWPLGHTPLECEKDAANFQFELEQDLQDLQTRNVFPVDRYLDILDRCVGSGRHARRPQGRAERSLPSTRPR